MRKWNSNSKTVRESIKVEENSSTHQVNEIDQENDKSIHEEVTADPGKDSIATNSQSRTVESEEDCYVKFLGINWNVNTDEFRYDVTELLSYVNTLPNTKRSVLKLAAKIFDPMGLLTSFTINMKVFFQFLYKGS